MLCYCYVTSLFTTVLFLVVPFFRSVSTMNRVLTLYTGATHKVYCIETLMMFLTCHIGRLNTQYTYIKALSICESSATAPGSRISIQWVS